MALVTTGKPIVSLHAVRLVQFPMGVGNAFPKIPRWRASSRLRHEHEAQSATG